MTALLRLAVFITAVLAMSIAAAVTAYGHLQGVEALLTTDSIVVGKFDVIKTGVVKVGPVEKAPVVYNVTLPNGQEVQVAYLPAGSIVRVYDGWIIGLYRLA